jgi:hypothetical protein
MVTAALAGARLDPPDLQRGARDPTLEGNRLASPEMRTRPGISGTMSVVAGGAPVRNRNIWAKVRRFAAWDRA